MRRRVLTVLVFALGGVAIPLGSSLITVPSPQLVAQDETDAGDLNRRRPRIALEDPADDDQSPQDAYLDLVKQKLRLLTPEQLARETVNLRRELLELEANQKLQEAENRLQQLIEQHPGSAAAARAAAMLDSLRQSNPQFPRQGAPAYDSNGGSKRTEDSIRENYDQPRPSRDPEDSVPPRRPIPKPVPNASRNS